MKKIKLKAPAKINLALDVLGTTSEGFHQIKSLVASIDLYDYITIEKRKDYNIILKCKGIDPNCSAVDNNAYKSAKRFAKAFKTNGVNITVDKRIPVGGGLGGSSADIAGVLNGMKTLYGVKQSVEPIADSLGSDSKYMLKGGWATLSGRGEEQEFLELDFPLYLVIVTASQGVSAKDSYQEFDRQNLSYPLSTDQAVKAVIQGDFKELCALAKNHLQPASSAILPQIKENLLALESAGAPLAIMTGSGSAVLGVFDNKKDRDKVYKKLKKAFGGNIIKAKTI